MPKWAYALAALALVYFPVAAWLHASFVDITPKGRLVVQIMKPFLRYNNASIPFPLGVDRFNEFGDDALKTGDATSPIMLYENDKPLGPAHSTFADIDHLGGGRFSHFKDREFVFSSSDNTDPNKNQRSYWMVLP